MSHQKKYGRPISHWTSRELAQEVIKQGIVESISPRQVGRLLKEATLKTTAIRVLVKSPPDEKFEEKVKDICQLYQQAIKFEDAGRKSN